MYKLRNKRFMTSRPWMPFVANGLILVATSVVLQFVFGAGMALYNGAGTHTSTPAARTAPAMQSAPSPTIQAAPSGFNLDATQIAIGAVSMCVLIGIFVSIRRTREEQR